MYCKPFQDWNRLEGKRMISKLSDSLSTDKYPLKQCFATLLRHLANLVGIIVTSPLCMLPIKAQEIHRVLQRCNFWYAANETKVTWLPVVLGLYGNLSTLVGSPGEELGFDWMKSLGLARAGPATNHGKSSSVEEYLNSQGLTSLFHMLP